jgi:hypothetical protein
MAKPVINLMLPFIRSIDTRFHYGQAILGDESLQDENNDDIF